MLQSILVALDGSPFSDAVTKLALEWAGKYKASLLGLGVIDEPGIAKPEAVSIGGAAFKKERDETRLADATARVHHMLDLCRTRAIDAKVDIELLEEVGDPTECILREAQRADIVMLGRETHFHFETQNGPDKTLGDILRGSPRPVVVVPQTPEDGRGVMVAYGGGREVARTLQMFQLLGLAGEDTIHLVSVQREGWEAEALAHRAADYLRAHGSRVELHNRHADGPPAHTLMAEVRRLKPKLVVMGAQGHHPIRDLFETSVTRAMLRSCPVPVFIGA